MFNLPYEVALEGALVFIRVGAILFALPFFGDSSVPVRVRILLSVALSFLIYPIIDRSWFGIIPNSLLGFFVLIIKELGVGLLIGFTAKMAFEGLVSAAQIVSYQMGFGTASLIMPNADQMMDTFTAFHRTLVILFFLSLDLHGIYISAILQTFKVLPAGMISVDSSLGSFFISITANIFSVALQLAAPIIIALMFSMAGLGLMARTVPQLNVFVLSFPISFAIGLSIYIACLPFFPSWIGSHFSQSQTNILTTLKGLMP